MSPFASFVPTAPASPFKGPVGPLGAWECNLADETLSWTDGVYAIFGLRPGAAISRGATLDLYENHSRLEMNRLRAQAIATGRAFSLDCRIRSVGGERRWMRLVVGVGHRHGRAVRIFGSKQDVTAEKGAWAALAAEAAVHGVLALPEQRSFDDALRLFRSAAAPGETCALVLFAIDNAPRLLAEFGRPAFEALLQCIEQRLARLFPDAVQTMRHGEAGFAVLMPATQDRPRLAATLESARHLLRRPLAHGAAVLDFTVSAGATLSVAETMPDRHRLFAEAEAGLAAVRLTDGDGLRLFDGPARGYGALRPA